MTTNIFSNKTHSRLLYPPQFPFDTATMEHNSSGVQSAFFSIKEAATYLNVCEKQIYTLVHHPDFPAVKIGKNWRIGIEGLHQWLSQTKSRLQ